MLYSPRGRYEGAASFRMRYALLQNCEKIHLIVMYLRLGHEEQPLQPLPGAPPGSGCTTPAALTVRIVAAVGNTASRRKLTYSRQLIQIRNLEKIAMSKGTAGR